MAGSCGAFRVAGGSSIICLIHGDCLLFFVKWGLRRLLRSLFRLYSLHGQVLISIYRRDGLEAAYWSTKIFCLTFSASFF